MRCVRCAPLRAAPSVSVGPERLCRSSQRFRGCGGASLLLRAWHRRSSPTLPRRPLRPRGRGPRRLRG
eukprot:10900690-Alexandrium_andersonii.AAC.1